ncbi:MULTISPECIES: enoyl-CoA hydratase/isomerase family protein [unclassified Bradyrhizobium]|uniref:enoyl-CoA hydratase/isomerase family protein n=1 Tax=unclassified Bradyrhizobium TaxID=2631580 RepID=UPI0020B40385|nr:MULTISPECIES: enoyl-CoA hydratase/isomerase family protein [unclassified Bradyrhizobium]MCP3379889.1 enoyl-CoA hydratase/isomerase family protein [Bradyrhizobium sp. CCGUVB4N]MCP3440722.1 enoyl-CoA hydratase/isomerase family protein [Bradyrhizobium sp. CCGUVB14]
MLEAPQNQPNSDELLSEVREGVLILKINRLNRYNAWTSDVRDQLAGHLTAAGGDPGIRAAILTGAGDKAFCSGQDLWELQAFKDGSEIGSWLGRLTRCYDAVRQFPKPFIAAVNGVAAGSGFQVTQFCDLVVTHAGVTMGQTEINSGLPSIFGTWLMWERVGRRAIELSLQGRLMNAEEARSLGFVHEIVPQEGVLSAALRAAERLSKQPQVAYSLSKRANTLLDEDRYRKAIAMAMEAYEQAFNVGAPQKEIERFFERRRYRKKLAEG